MQFIYSDKAPKPVGSYSQAVKADEFIFCSGQIGLIPETSQIIEGGVKAQTVQIFANIIEVLKEAGADHKPARDTVEVANLPLGALVEISITAYKSNI
jgi:2-iminobutanoate/2-iminopropanoate deaminase